MPLQYDPEWAHLAAPFLQARSQAPRLALHDVAGRRARIDAVFGATVNSRAVPDDVEQLEHYVEADDGHKIRVLHLRKKEQKEQGKKAAAVVHMHGGGLIALTADVAVPFACALASQTGAQILTVDYRLAPERPFPAPLEDCLAALKWVHDNAEELSIRHRSRGGHG